jgi:DNA repair exonuclease SbcCD ATPase subunit
MERTKLRQILVDYFSAGELRTLCFDLDVDYASLPGEGTANKARELVAYARRHGRLPELEDMLRRLRPRAPWGEPPQTEVSQKTGRVPPLPPPRQSSAELESLRHQLAELEANLSLIEQRKSQYVMDVDIPLQLVKQEQAQQARIADLKARIAHLESGAPDQTEEWSLQTDSRQGELRAQLEIAERVLAVYETQAAGYTTLTIPAHLAVNLEEQRKKVDRLRAELAAS